MKIFSIIAQLIAAGLIIFNASHVNLNAPFKNQSLVALITILACAIVILYYKFYAYHGALKKNKKKLMIFNNDFI